MISLEPWFVFIVEKISLSIPLMTDFKPAAFLSYVHSDDDHDRGRISRIRERLEGEIRMHTGAPFQIFQDRNDLEWGQNWQSRIDDSLSEVSFLIRVITPSYFASPACRKEFEKFSERERDLGSDQLILPVYYLSADQIDETNNQDKIGVRLRSRQYSDWRHLRFFSLDSPEIAKHLADLASDVKSRVMQLQDIIVASKAPIQHPTPEGKTEQLLKQIKSSFKTGATLKAIGPRPFESLVQPEMFPSADEADEADDCMGQSVDPTADERGYAIYTTEFDEVVTADSFLSGREAVILTKIITGLASEIEEKHGKELKVLERNIGEARGSASMSITMLLDNSGSLRGRPISFLSAWSLVLAERFDRAGCDVEVIGFTTRAWKGGQSREKWLNSGRVSYPGRLNDLRYIVYKEFSQSIVGIVQNFGVMLREGMLKENIDGEALLFAKDRLERQHAVRKMLAVFSDGAPVDDSTMQANGDGYLVNHLAEVIPQVHAAGIDLVAVGVDHDVRKYYEGRGVPSTAENIGVDFANVFRATYRLTKNPRRKKAPKKTR